MTRVGGTREPSGPSGPPVTLPVPRANPPDWLHVKSTASLTAAWPITHAATSPIHPLFLFVITTSQLR